MITLLVGADGGNTEGRPDGGNSAVLRGPVICGS